MVTTSLYEQIYTVKQFEKAKKFKPIKSVEIFQPNSEKMTYFPEGNSEWNLIVTHKNGKTESVKSSDWLVDKTVEWELKNGSKIIVNYETLLKGHSHKAPAKKCPVTKMIGDIKGLENSVKRIF